MSIERVARTLLGAVTLCGMLVSTGCGGLLSGNNSAPPPGGTPIANVKGAFDWGESLLLGGTVGIGMFPAKFTFDATVTPSCMNDYVAFNTSQLGISPTTAATQGTNSFAATGTPVGTFTITHGATSLILTAGVDFVVVDNAGTGSAMNAASLAAAITALGGPVGVTATSATSNVFLTAVNKGIEGNSITVFLHSNQFHAGWRLPWRRRNGKHRRLQQPLCLGRR